MKFYYNEQKVRESKTKEYTHAVIREKEDGSIVVWGCMSSLALAMKQIDKARSIRPEYKVVVLEKR